MGRAQKFTVKMPEGGAERFEYLLTHHECPEGKALAEQGDDDPSLLVADMILFPYGLVGMGMPRGVPFEVPTSEPCAACGKYLRAWFVWEPKTFFAGVGNGVEL